MVSKALLAEFITAKKRSKPFKALGSEHMNKPCPVIPSNLTSSALQSLEFQMDAFCLRERDLLNRFAMEVSQRQKQGESKEYSVLLFQSYQPAEDLGRAFSDRSILQTFIDVEATVPVGSLKLRVTVTDLVKICLCHLYG
ncbi:putative acyl-CoA oxidase [Rosa chinensis]|uniref:Putative acyl-CoA oxidase n=1 Tax=Rosa chinensis TaxID=74649 RepID=A0A2P6P967_ROSCH|nr:putative acyl-CoA oxidase [Rosa chinensis]